MTTHRYIFLSFFLLLSLSAISQKKFTREQLVADADTLYQTIYDVHPNMFAVYPKNKFDKEFAVAKSSLKDSMTVDEFYILMAPLVVKLGDGHTGLSPARMNRNKKILFPFNVQIEKDRSISVKNDFSGIDPLIPEKAKIVSINDRKSEDIVADVLSLISGEKEHFKIAGINSNGANLGYFYYLLYGDKDFDIKYSFNGKVLEKTASALSANQIMDSAKSVEGESVKPKMNYSLRLIDDEDIAIIEFNSFSDPKKFDLFIDSAFTVIQNKGIANLIIDIRANGGGNSGIGDEFFQYISPVPFQQFGTTDKRISRRLKNYWKKNDPLKYYSHFMTSDTIHSYKVTDDMKPSASLRENPLRYTGKSYLLISNFTFSSAASFSWAFKYFNMGTVVGEETGGLAVAFGDIETFSLPNTKLYHSVSWKKFYKYGATDENMHGTLPDYEVPADQAMDFTLELIKKEKSGL